jgi:hypothetical protein
MMALTYFAETRHCAATGQHVILSGQLDEGTGTDAARSKIAKRCSNEPVCVDRFGHLAAIRGCHLVAQAANGLVVPASQAGQERR